MFDNTLIVFKNKSSGKYLGVVNDIMIDTESFDDAFVTVSYPWNDIKIYDKVSYNKELRKIKLRKLKYDTTK
jgi:hypothetical protein